MFVVSTRFVKNSHIWARIFVIILKNIVKGTSNSLNTEFQP